MVASKFADSEAMRTALLSRKDTKDMGKKLKGNIVYCVRTHSRRVSDGMDFN